MSQSLLYHRLKYIILIIYCMKNAWRPKHIRISSCLLICVLNWHFVIPMIYLNVRMENDIFHISFCVHVVSVMFVI